MSLVFHLACSAPLPFLLQLALYLVSYYYINFLDTLSYSYLRLSPVL